MNPLSSLPSFVSFVRPLGAVAAAVALLAACGGGGDSASAAAAPNAVSVDDDDNDNVDAATLATIERIVASAGASADASGLSSVAAAGRPGFVGGDRPVTPGPIPIGPLGAPGLAAADGQATPAAGRIASFPGVRQTNLVANTPAFGAQIVEPALKNPWGIAIRPAGLGGHWWLAASGSGQSIQYVGDVDGTPLFQDALKVVDTSGPATGVVFNPGAQFVITQQHANGPITAPAKFLFANASGTISAWTERADGNGGFDHPADSVVVVDGSARRASFLGIAVAPASDRIYAADFGAEAALRVYDGGFVEQPALANPYRRASRPQQPGDFEAFNVQTIGQSTFAMYGRHVAPDPNAAPPAEGRLAEFDAEGRLAARWRGRGHLNYPWGVARAPDDFGIYGGCLLVGNFGDGTIVAFHPRLKAALDYVRDAHGKRVVIDGLWGLQFGNGASLGEADQMYFAAGPNKEADGLFGKLEAVARTQPSQPATHAAAATATARSASMCR